MSRTASRPVRSSPRAGRTQLSAPTPTCAELIEAQMTLGSRSPRARYVGAWCRQRAIWRARVAPVFEKRGCGVFRVPWPRKCFCVAMQFDGEHAHGKRGHGARAKRGAAALFRAYSDPAAATARLIVVSRGHLSTIIMFMFTFFSSRGGCHKGCQEPSSDPWSIRRRDASAGE